MNERTFTLVRKPITPEVTPDDVANGCLVGLDDEAQPENQTRPWWVIETFYGLEMALHAGVMRWD